MNRSRTLLLLPWLALSCMKDAEPPAEAQRLQPEPRKRRAPGAPPMSKPEGGFGGLAKDANEDDAEEQKKGKRASLSSLEEVAAAAPKVGIMADPAKPAEAAAEAPAPVRSWFPETFLFEPRVLTDESGRALVEARVPDRLTTWQVLALAHTRGGQQGGAVTELLGTLPIYIEPILPRFLYSGDQVRASVQVVNTTGEAAFGKVHVSIEGGEAAAIDRRVELRPNGIAVIPLLIRAKKPGEITVRAVLDQKDAVEERILVRPAGQKLVIERSGTLAAPRALAFEGPKDALLDGGRLRVQVLLGAPTILATELGTVVERSGAAEDAYGLLLAGRAKELAERVGLTLDAGAQDELTKVLAQRAIRHVRSPSLDTAQLFLEATLAHPDRPVLARIAERLSGQVAGAQRPDGTFGGGSGWPLNRLLVTTAESLRALATLADQPQHKTKVEAARLRAARAFERTIGRVEDPYTAAVMLASRGPSGSAADNLKKKVRDAVVQREDGSRVLPVGPGALRADGVAPSEIEATAVAALALHGDPETPWVADLGAAVLGAYRPGLGFGDGRANLWCLRAVLQLFETKLPKTVTVTVTEGDEIRAEQVLEAQRAKDLLTLEVPLTKPAGPHHFTLGAAPAIPGLAYVATLEVFVPWKAPDPRGALELSLEQGRDMAVGRPITLTLTARAPAGRRLRLKQQLPAGVAPDVPSLEALVTAGTIERFETEEGAVELALAPLSPGAPFSASFRVVPTLAGTLSTGPAKLSIVGARDALELPPQRWTIRP